MATGRLVRRLPVALLGALVLLPTWPSVASAHGGGLVTPDSLWSDWSFEPLVVFGVILVAACYGRGLRRLWRRAGVGRGVRRWQAGAFAAGLLALLIALVSPLDALSDVLFSAHMAQHMILIVVAAPLLVLGAPALPLLWMLPGTWRRRLSRWWRRSPRLEAGWSLLSRPVVVWLLFTVTIWIWHIRALYQAALESTAVHGVEHATLLGVALLFWWAVIHPVRLHRAATVPSIVTIFAAGMQSAVLGALITFSSTPWYPDYAQRTLLWGLTPLGDQQLAGAIMWIPTDTIFLLAVLILLGAWLQALNRADGRERAALPPARG